MEIAPPHLPLPLPAKPLTGAALAQGPKAAPETDQDRVLRERAQQFEAVYIAEMLKHTGINAMPMSYGGGEGEEAFSSFLTQEYARLLAVRGGIGLAEQIFAALKIKAETP
jgi:Rod binding domain-containing protein